VLLKYPYPREVSEPVQYDCIKVHAQMGQPKIGSDSLRLSVSIAMAFYLNFHRLVYKCSCLL